MTHQNDEHKNSNVGM